MSTPDDAPGEPTLRSFTFADCGVRAVIEDAPELLTPVGTRFAPTHVDMALDDDHMVTEFTVSAVRTEPVLTWVRATYRRDGEWPERFEDASSWLLDLLGISAPPAVPLDAPQTPDLAVTEATGRPFSGIEWRFTVTGAPPLLDGLLPRREFSPTAVCVLRYREGHRRGGGDGSWTEVRVVGDLIDRPDRPGMAEWSSDARHYPWSSSPDRRFESMPRWLHALVQQQTGFDLSAHDGLWTGA